MPAKPSLDKVCWQWAETTDPENVMLEHVRTAYRLNLPVCKLGSCKRQCKGNPYCINCIGEKVWFGKIEDSSWHDVQDPLEECRKAGMSTGLKNLGATCYVNTFLQLWFNNETIRKGVYEWCEAGFSEEQIDTWEPTSVCSHLQVIFGLLELSRRRYVDPSEFIKHLGLDAGLQQDAQEFSKLFLSVLEQNLMEGASLSFSNYGNVIKEQFCGKYAYVTRCSKCATASERLSEFYELDLNIQGQKTLAEALKGFLEVEKLDGDNQYMCNTCNAKQDATRAIELKSLPPVLNLQLLRFVFDLKTGSKKKLNSCIQFPDILDMTEFMQSDTAAIYDLSAVLIHGGPSAYSGHYVAHIKGKDSQAWYKFNDEDVEKIKGKNLQLGSEEDLESKKQKTARTPKGHHSSKNAYMLVYTRRKNLEPNNHSSELVESVPHTADELAGGSCLNDVTGDAPPTSDLNVNENCCNSQVTKQEKRSQIEGKSAGDDHQKEEKTRIRNNEALEDTETSVAETTVSASAMLPKYVLRYVEKDNEKFQNWINELHKMRDENIAKGQEKQETVKAIYQDLPYTLEDQNKYEWLPMSWFSKWLNDPATAPEVDVKKFLCSHQKVCPDLSIKMKCVSQHGANQLFDIYGGNLRLQGDESLCEKCVQNKCHLIRTKKRLTEDDKFILAAMKTDFSSEKLYWVGKSSFRSWKRLAIEQLNLEEEKHAKERGKSVSQSNSDEENEDASGRNKSGGDSDSNDVNTCKRYESKFNDNNLKQSRKAVENYFGNKRDVRKAVSPVKAFSDSTMNSVDHESVSVGQSKSEPNFATSDRDDKFGENLQFNEDILCEEHSGLHPDASSRKLIPESVWLKLKRYFPGSPEYDWGSEPCSKCQASLAVENMCKEENRQLAAAQKACLLDLFHDRRRPTNVAAGDIIYLVNAEFVDYWRKFVRDPVKCEPIRKIVNESLLCEHEGFLFPPLEMEKPKCDSKVVCVTADEWQTMTDLFDVDFDIRMVNIVENGKQDIVIFPKVCDDCLQSRLNNEEGEMFEFERGVVYVRKQHKLDQKPVDSYDNTDSNTDDPEFREKSGTARKRAGTGGYDVHDPPEKFLKNQNGIRTIRKSQRHRKTKGEKEISISSKNTLKELKLEIMKLFSIPPFDQNLYVDGRLLDGNDLSLCDLKVVSGSVIDLIADEPNEEISFLEDFTKESGVPESGFKGTNLLSA